MTIPSLTEHYNRLAPQRDYYRAKNTYYYSLLNNQYRFLIPKNKKILEIGCGTGDLLNFLLPSTGVGIDISEGMITIARQKYPHLQFETGAIFDYHCEMKFDYIVLSGVVGEAQDIQRLFEAVRPFCTQDTRIVIEFYNYFWQFLVKVGEYLRLKIPQRIQNWVTTADINNFLTLADYEMIKTENCIIFPINIIGISYFLNKFVAYLPGINRLTLTHFVVARARVAASKRLSVTILVPCRNERENIESVITRTPQFGLSQEFIFVEGWSRDGTYEEIERVRQKYPDRDIKLFKQSGKGKGDALRLGFSKASGDVLMILDADLTVSPEELPKFYAAIETNRGEFINGSRLVYPLEKEAMRFLNLLANKIFGLFFSWLLGQRFKDTLCGTKVLAKRHYDEIAAHRAYFGDFDPFGDFDLIFGATKLNLKILELPIRYKERRYGTTQIQRFRHGVLLLRMCLFAMRKMKFRY